MEKALAATQPQALLQARRSFLKPSGREISARSEFADPPSPLKYRDPEAAKFTIAEVKSGALADLDPTRLEAYLTDEDFLALLGYTREEFYSLKPWKRTSVKEEKLLF